ncbi:hypothetical protein DYE49_11170 [Treponema rectale]|uniref:Fibronectin type-III domain-containing protein n=1 Tax=Treponema rectale TaxID=744512 RepID=A0A840SHX9_9SPIR|nr:fibronectin type III domain-containing protein [Treponema rectale]MBB5219123.1 hypothetical protein [Treponema rectale]QOS40975.1 hypothetical protein DYE49_11170 [Treponema rectale]
MKKVILLFFTAASLLFSGCNDLSEDSSSASLTLDKESITISNALGGATSATVTATLTGSSSSLEWFSADKSIVTVTGSGNFAVILCQGKAGTANVGVRTADNSLEAVCSVSVSLSSAPASCVTDLALTEDSETASGFTLTWTDPVRASAVVIDVFESEEDRTAGIALAEASSTAEPDLYKSYTVDLNLASYVISDLITNSTGKEYYVAVYGYLNGKRSLSAMTVDVQLKPDTNAPADITNVESSVTEHSIELTWTEPSDDDYAGVVVTLVSPVKDFAGNAIASSELTKTIGAGTTKAAFSNLAANTEHEFTFYTYDSNGNKQGDANNESAGSTKTVKTEEDTTAPAVVTNVSAGFTVNGNVSVTWTDPSDRDFKEIIVTAACSTDGYNAPASQTIASGVNNAIFSCDTDAEYTFTVTAYDYDGNASAGITADAVKPVPELTSVTAASYGSGLFAEWKEADIADSSVYSYTYQFLCYTDEDCTNLAATIDVPTGNSKWVLGYGLDFETTYYFVLQTYVYETENLSNNAGYKSSVVCTATMPEKVVATTIKNSKTSAYIVPNTSGTVYCVSSSAANASYSAAWIVRPALDFTSTYTYTGGNDSTTGTVSTFSLEATDADGNPTGKFLYVTNLSTSNTSTTDGTPVLLEQGNIDDVTHASFFQAFASYASTGYKSIRSTYDDGGFMLGNDSAGNVLKYRYSLNVAGVNNWHWYMDISEE